jgi:NADH-quinone oxidoreductase subunit K
MVTLAHYLLASGLLFATGLAGVLLRRNLIIILMSLEMMLSASTLTLVAFSRYQLSDGHPRYDGQVFVFFIITVNFIINLCESNSKRSNKIRT